MKRSPAMDSLPGSSKGLHEEKKATDMAGPSSGKGLNGIQHRATPSVGFSLPPGTANSKKTELSTMEEEDEGVDEPWDSNELSAEAQAHNISMFLSSSNSDSGW